MEMPSSRPASQALCLRLRSDISYQEDFLVSLPLKISCLFDLIRAALSFSFGDYFLLEFKADASKLGSDFNQLLLSSKDRYVVNSMSSSSRKTKDNPLMFMYSIIILGVFKDHPSQTKGKVSNRVVWLDVMMMSKENWFRKIWLSETRSCRSSWSSWHGVRG